MRVACRTSYHNACHTGAAIVSSLDDLYQDYKRSGKVNGKDAWKSNDNQYGVWFSKNGKWMIGDWNDRGSNVGYAYSPKNTGCPLDAEVETWKYYYNGKWNNGNKSIKPWCV